MTGNVAPGAEQSVDETIEAALARLPAEAQTLAAQGIKAARVAHEGGYGYLGALVNMRVVESDGSGATLTMDVTPNALNRYGFVHGGMLFTLADYAMGETARALAPEGTSPVTLEAKANYISNIKEGRLIARCETLHRSERLIMIETRIANAEDDELVMIVTGTYYVIPRRDDRP